MKWILESDHNNLFYHVSIYSAIMKAKTRTKKMPRRKDISSSFREANLTVQQLVDPSSAAASSGVLVHSSQRCFSSLRFLDLFEVLSTAFPAGQGLDFSELYDWWLPKPWTATFQHHSSKVSHQQSKGPATFNNVPAMFVIIPKLKWSYNGVIVIILE